jgi:REP element-mobilizing transposase RayT
MGGPSAFHHMQLSAAAPGAHARNKLIRMLGEVRAKYRFRILGYVVMPEHLHLLISK